MTWIIVLVIGLIVGYFLGRGMTTADPKREKVLALFQGGAEVFNDQVQAVLGVSDATATRYLEALEREGKIHQVGSTGRGVVYKAN